MTDALARLLENYIDYAGLFPPAKLSMRESVANYLAYRQGKEASLVGRFVCPTTRLGELRSELADISGDPIPVGVVSPPTQSLADWQFQLESDASEMTRFIREIEGKAEIEAFEARVPSTEGMESYVRDLRAFDQVDVFCEIPWSDHISDSLAVLAEEEWIGAKARTGGLDAAAFPSSAQLAEFLQQCVQLDLMFKATAGLHHPIRGFREEVGTSMHGFLNVMISIALLQSHDLTRKEIEAVLDCEDSHEFEIKANSIKFREWTADSDDVVSARANFAGIGSCSVQEPYEDLQALGLM